MKYNIIEYLRRKNALQKINIALSKASCGSMRVIDQHKPATWEFSGFSQNGEDGIVDFLVEKLKEKNRYFIEIGAANGIENNSAWLAIAKRYSGLMVEGDRSLSEYAKKIYKEFSLGVECMSMFVNTDSIQQILNASLTTEPDYFSLDIDGNDYYIMKKMLENNFQPKIVTVEYNSAYGPELKMTISYDADFRINLNGYEHLYYGVSLSLWKKLFSDYGYRFITVDQNGVNAFFVRNDQFEKEYLDKIEGIGFAENFYQRHKFKCTWQKQYEIIKHRDFYRTE